MEARAVAIGGNRSITIGGGGMFGRGLLIRYRHDGRIDRSFGRNGRMSLPTLSLTDLALARCGLLVTGTRIRNHVSSMALVALPHNGLRSGAKAHIHYPFGLKYDSFAGGLVPTDGRHRIVLGGDSPSIPAAATSPWPATGPLLSPQGADVALGPGVGSRFQGLGLVCR